MYNVFILRLAFIYLLGTSNTNFVQQRANLTITSFCISKTTILHSTHLYQLPIIPIREIEEWSLYPFRARIR